MSYKIIRLSSFSILLFFFQSCQIEIDQSRTTVNGVVTNRITNEPVEGIPIKIIESQGWTGKYLTTTQTVYTDATGRYKTSFTWKKVHSYKVAIGFNNVLATLPYPHYSDITKGINNTVNYSQLPLKTLQIRVKVLKHDKNWLRIGFQTTDTMDYYSYNLFWGPNPVNDFDTTYQLRIQAGRRYRAHLGLSNNVSPNTFQDEEFIYNSFDMKNVDTTRIDLIIP